MSVGSCGGDDEQNEVEMVRDEGNMEQVLFQAGGNTVVGEDVLLRAGDLVVASWRKCSLSKVTLL
jgi:hypothetical protein